MTGSEKGRVETVDNGSSEHNESPISKGADALNDLWSRDREKGGTSPRLSTGQTERKKDDQEKLTSAGFPNHAAKLTHPPPSKPGRQLANKEEKHLLHNEKANETCKNNTIPTTPYIDRLYRKEGTTAYFASRIGERVQRIRTLSWSVIKRGMPWGETHLNVLGST